MLERTDARLYPAHSKRNQMSVAPATAAAEAFLRLQRSGSVTGARSGEAGSVSLAEGAGAARRPCRRRPWRERARAERRERKEEDAEAR